MFGILHLLSMYPSSRICWGVSIPTCIFNYSKLSFLHWSCKLRNACGHWKRVSTFWGCVAGIPYLHPQSWLLQCRSRFDVWGCLQRASLSCATHAPHGDSAEASRCSAAQVCAPSNAQALQSCTEKKDIDKRVPAVQLCAETLCVDMSASIVQQRYRKITWWCRCVDKIAPAMQFCT